MINEHDLNDLYEENKDKQPAPKPEPKPKPVQLSIEFELSTDDEIAAILATIPFGR
jgi:hypothetical protein